MLVIFIGKTPTHLPRPEGRLIGLAPTVRSCKSAGDLRQETPRYFSMRVSGSRCDPSQFQFKWEGPLFHTCTISGLQESYFFPLSLQSQAGSSFKQLLVWNHIISNIFSLHLIPTLTITLFQYFQILSIQGKFYFLPKS